MQFQDKIFHRFPKESNPTLRAWNAADEHLLKYIHEEEIKLGNTAIYQDRFGFLSVILNDKNPSIITTNKSQEKAILYNRELNNIQEKISFNNPLENKIKNWDSVLVKVPKSLDLWDLYLYQISRNIKENGIVLAGFMTKYFTSQIIKIAEKYFESVEQTKAWKKSRLIILKNKKEVQEKNIIRSVKLNEDISLQQYQGVFSANHIDYATQFLLEHFELKNTEQKILDLASGNGVIAHHIHSLKDNLEIHLMDDSYLAVESSKLNLQGENIYFHYNHCLEEFEDHSFDLIISNPPFHFEHEIDINIPLQLFREAHQKLKSTGRLVIVANSHLNYGTHLSKIFGSVEIINRNKKFEVIAAVK